jgi:phosphoadenosine phosphosulfate reductase
MSILADTQAIFEAAKKRTGGKIIIAFSGGKDSLVIMDMACRMFDQVEAYFMYLVPHLECVDEEIEKGRKRFGVNIRMYPHWILQKMVQEGVYTSEWFGYQSLPEWKLRDVYAFAIKDIGINCVATGAKATDSSWRRRFMSTAHFDAVINPIAKWHKYDVISYLRSHDIALPPSSGKSATGVDLSTPSLLWLHDQYPKDYARLLKVFPFAQAVIARREMYGVIE